MALKITAIGALRPKLKLGKRVEKRQLVNYLADRTNLSEGQIDLVLKELRDAIIFFGLAGQGVKIEGLGTYKAKIGMDGKLGITHLADSYLLNALNMPGAFTGEVENRENIGKSGDDLVVQWNTANPDNPVT